MLQKTTVTSCRNSILSGYADTDRFPPKKIGVLPCDMQREPEKLLKNGSSTIAFVDENFFIKCNPVRSRFDALRKLFRKSRAENSRVMSQKLFDLGIPTPQVVCAVRERQGHKIVCDYLVTDVLPEETTVFLSRLRFFELEKQAEIITKIASILKLLNQNGICHGDASLRNFYLDTTSNKVGVIDLDGCKTIAYWQRKNILIKETARVISSFMICSKNPSSENYQFALQIFENVYGKDVLPEQILQKRVDKFIRKTTKKQRQV